MQNKCKHAHIEWIRTSSLDPYDVPAINGDVDREFHGVSSFLLREGGLLDRFEKQVARGLPWGSIVVSFQERCCFASYFRAFDSIKRIVTQIENDRTRTAMADQWLEDYGNICQLKDSVTLLSVIHAFLFFMGASSHIQIYGDISERNRLLMNNAATSKAR